MNESRLYALRPQYRTRVPSSFFTTLDATPPALQGYAEPIDPEVDVTHAIEMGEEAIRRFDDGRESESDAWLAPRLHATLRMSRRHAADLRVWDYLAMGPMRRYVYWRWHTEQATVDSMRGRFFGDFRKHAIARLWWGAELTRNGSSYETTKLFFSNTDVPNSWINLRALRHRPAAVACIRFIHSHTIDGVPLGDRHRSLVISLNSALTTTVLDAMSQWTGSDEEAVEQWRREQIDSTLYLNDEPEGPAEPAVNQADVERISEFLVRIAEKTNFQRRRRSGAAEDVAAVD